MRYVIVSVVKGEAGDFNNNLRKDVFRIFEAKSSKLPAHFTIKAPFEYDGSIEKLEKSLQDFAEKEKAEPYRIEGFEHFDDRVIYMKVAMSKKAKEVHDRLIDIMSKFPYMDFRRKDGKDKTFHVTITSKKLPPKFNKIWDYVNKIQCDFDCSFDNICIYKWEDYTWKLYREFNL